MKNSQASTIIIKGPRAMTEAWALTNLIIKEAQAMNEAHASTIIINNHEWGSSLNYDNKGVSSHEKGSSLNINNKWGLSHELGLSHESGLSLNYDNKGDSSHEKGSSLNINNKLRLEHWMMQQPQSKKVICEAWVINEARASIILWALSQWGSRLNSRKHY